MNVIGHLSLAFSKKLPVHFQTEASECGTVCLSMIAAYYGLNVDPRLLRENYPVSLKGATLSNIIKIAKRLNFEPRAVRLELGNLKELRVPCILHWNFNHFVVLKEVRRSNAIIHDPARGARTVSFKELSLAFTGIALELWPSTEFKQQGEKSRISLRSMTGSVTGLKRSVFQILLLTFALEILTVTSPLSAQWVIDGVLVSGDENLLETLVIGFALLLLMQQVVTAFRSWIVLHMSTTIGMQWKANVFRHLLSLPVNYFEKRHVSEVVSRFSTLDSIQQTLTTSFFGAALDGAMSVATLMMMFLYSPMLGMIAVAAMVLYGCGRAIWYRPLRELTENAIVRGTQTQNYFFESIRGMRAIQLFQRQEERRSGWLSLLVGQVNANIRTQKLQLLHQQWNGLILGVEAVLVLWIGAQYVIDGFFSVGMLISFIAYKGQFDTRVSRLIDNYFSVKMLQVQRDRLADIVLTSPEPGGKHSNNEGKDIAGCIEVSGVQYRYAHGEPTILRYVDFKINAGEAVAIVGPTGCGKTTLLNIMLGILAPTRGQVRVDGIDLAYLGNEYYRQSIGAVMQDDVLFAGSIADNISFFDANINRSWMVECAEITSVHDEIMAMPMGYNTLVGDMGAVLSGGQKQRILLARALYKRPRILFLDEATCHLDIDRERKLVAAIGALRITRIMVAHRPQTICVADRVIVLCEGVVAKDCHPSELSLDNTEIVVPQSRSSSEVTLTGR